MGILRLLLALCVITAHAGPVLGFFGLGGTEAVQTFYMISGFYMALILSQKYIGPGSTRLFLTNRALRIFPLYWAVTLLVLVMWLLLSHFAADSGPLALRHAGFSLGTNLLLAFSNLFIFGQELVMFTATNPQGHLVFTSNYHNTDPMLYTYLLIPQAWSLSVELCFYLCVPLLAPRSTRFLVALLLSGFAIRLFLMFGLHLQNDPWSYRFFPAEISFFVAGMLAYRLYARLRLQPLPPAVVAFVFTAFFGFFTAYQFLPNFWYHGFLLKQWAFYLAAWLAIPILFLTTGRSRLDRYIGELSYPVYITHAAAAVLAQHLLTRFQISRGHAPLTMLLSIASSILLIHTIVVPLERARQRRVQTQLHPDLPVPAPTPEPAYSTIAA